jgi:hypothetical protein
MLLIYLSPRAHFSIGTFVLYSLCSFQITFSGFINVYILLLDWPRVCSAQSCVDLYSLKYLLVSFPFLLPPLLLFLSLFHTLSFIQTSLSLGCRLLRNGTLLILTRNHQTRLPPASATQLKTPWLWTQTISPLNAICFRYKPRISLQTTELNAPPRHAWKNKKYSATQRNWKYGGFDSGNAVTLRISANTTTVLTEGFPDFPQTVRDRFIPRLLSRLTFFRKQKEAWDHLALCLCILLCLPICLYVPPPSFSRLRGLWHHLVCLCSP